MIDLLSPLVSAMLGELGDPFRDLGGTLRSRLSVKDTHRGHKVESLQTECTKTRTKHGENGTNLSVKDTHRGHKVESLLTS